MQLWRLFPVFWIQIVLAQDVSCRLEPYVLVLVADLRRSLLFWGHLICGKMLTAALKSIRIFWSDAHARI
jgi:hypothetical protein